MNVRQIVAGDESINSFSTTAFIAKSTEQPLQKKTNQLSTNLD